MNSPTCFESLLSSPCSAGLRLRAGAFARAPVAGSAIAGATAAAVTVGEEPPCSLCSSRPPACVGTQRAAVCSLPSGARPTILGGTPSPCLCRTTGCRAAASRESVGCSAMCRSRRLTQCLPCPEDRPSHSSRCSAAPCYSFLRRARLVVAASSIPLL